MSQRTATNEPLRERAKNAWLHHVDNQLKWELIITRQTFVLLERVYAICGHDYDVDLSITGWRVIARVDELKFISTYYELYKNLPPDSEDRCFGVRLWWKCEKCRQVRTSGVIYTDYDLGRQLETFEPQRSHRCRAKSSRC
jgi:hypothetical protein